MIRSRLRVLAAEKRLRTGQKCGYKEINEATGLARTTIARLMSDDPVDRIDGKSISKVCKFFNCGICDFLEYVPTEDSAQP